MPAAKAKAKLSKLKAELSLIESERPGNIPVNRSFNRHTGYLTGCKFDEDGQPRARRRRRAAPAALAIQAKRGMP